MCPAQPPGISVLATFHRTGIFRFSAGFPFRMEQSARWEGKTWKGYFETRWARVISFGASRKAPPLSVKPNLRET